MSLAGERAGSRERENVFLYSSRESERDGTNERVLCVWVAAVEEEEGRKEEGEVGFFPGYASHTHTHPCSIQ